MLAIDRSFEGILLAQELVRRTAHRTPERSLLPRHMRLPQLAASIGLLVCLAPMPARAAAAPGTYICQAYGYSLRVPAGWQILDRGCNKDVTRVLVSDYKTAVIGVEIAGVATPGLAFQQVVTRDLGKLGIPPAQIAFGWQTSGKTRFDMAVYSPSAQGSGPSISAYIVGSEQYGIYYAFEGFITATQPAAVTALSAQMRDIYGSIHFFKGSNAAFHPRRQTVPQPAASTNSTSLLDLALLLVVCGLAIVAVYLFSVRRNPSRVA